MAVSSLYQGRISYAAADLTDDDPLDTQLALNMANNALHFADSMGQVRVNYSARQTSEFLTTRTLVAADADQWLPIVTFGPFPITVGADGLPYKIRMRMAGRTSTDTNTITLRAVLSAPHINAQSARFGDTGVNVFEGSTSSDTSAWLSPTGGSNLLSLGVNDRNAMGTLLASRDSSGNPTQVAVAYAILKVWCMSPNTVEGELSALYAAEYVGV